MRCIGWIGLCALLLTGCTDDPEADSKADTHTDTHSLLARARDLGVSFRDGSKFSLSPQTSSHNPSSCLRLCFAYYEEAELQRAASALARALTDA